MSEQTGPRRPEQDWSDVEEKYSDTFSVHMNPWTAAISFGVRATRPEDDHKYDVRIRMAPHTAKALALMLIKQVRTLEESLQYNIDLPARVLQELGIPPEDWKRFSS